jgi:hypothetical protein
MIHIPALSPQDVTPDSIEALDQQAPAARPDRDT